MVVPYYKLERAEPVSEGEVYRKVEGRLFVVGVDGALGHSSSVPDIEERNDDGTGADGTSVHTSVGE